MEAARIGKDRTLVIERVEVPGLRAGGVVVNVFSTAVPSYTADVVAAATFHAAVMPELPFILGVSAVGRVHAVAEDVFDVRPGQLVHVDPQVYSHSNNNLSQDNILQGWSGVGPGYQNVQRLWKDGPFAEYMLCPAECLTIIPEPNSITIAQWSMITGLGVAYGGLLRANMRPGQTIIINGGTGQLGSLAVLLALSIGIAKVVVTGRNAAALDKVQQLDPQRVMPVAVSGTKEEAIQGLRNALGQKPADAAVDFAGNSKNPDSLLACLANLKQRGILSLVGSLDVPLPLLTGVIRRSEIEIRGSFMYERHVPRELINMVQAQVLKLDKIDVHEHPLSEIHEAIQATKGVGALGIHVVRPAPDQ